MFTSSNEPTDVEWFRLNMHVHSVTFIDCCVILLIKCSTVQLFHNSLAMKTVFIRSTYFIFSCLPGFSSYEIVHDAERQMSWTIKWGTGDKVGGTLSERKQVFWLCITFILRLNTKLRRKTWDSKGTLCSATSWTRTQCGRELEKGGKIHWRASLWEECEGGHYSK